MTSHNDDKRSMDVRAMFSLNRLRTISKTGSASPTRHSKLNEEWKQNVGWRKTLDLSQCD